MMVKRVQIFHTMDKVTGIVAIEVPSEASSRIRSNVMEMIVSSPWSASNGTEIGPTSCSSWGRSRQSSIERDGTSAHESA
jgi:hypothetical protein